MLRAYKTVFTLYRDDKKYYSSSSPFYIADEKDIDSLHKNCIVLTWNNIEDVIKMYYKLNASPRFYIDYRSKGRIIKFANRVNQDIKEWKDKNINLKCEVRIIECHPTIYDVLKYTDSKKALLYLKQCFTFDDLYEDKSKGDL